MSSHFINLFFDFSRWPCEIFRDDLATFLRWPCDSDFLQTFMIATIEFHEIFLLCNVNNKTSSKRVSYSPKIMVKFTI